MNSLMKKISLLLKLLGFLVLFVGLWYGNQEIKFTGLGLWFISLVIDLVLVFKNKFKSKLKETKTE